MQRTLASLVLAVGTMAVLAAYWIGLGGPFMLDDPENFVQLERYARGEVTWLGPIVSNGSGPLGRPLAMASFVASVWAGGYSPWVLKVGNLCLHLSTGMLVGWLALLVARRDRWLAPRAEWVAVLVAVLWMALPIHVSTVLYAVQRMTILAALLTLAGLVGYVSLRERLDRAGTSSPKAFFLLAAWLGVTTALAGHAKENGLLLPLLAAVLEFTLFRARTPARRAAVALIAAGAVVGLVGSALVLALRPELVVGGYAIRDFTLAERLLTQPRVLWDYVSAILVPNGPSHGLFHDDYPISRSWSEPWTTGPALAAWLALVATAVAMARHWIAFSTGVLLFVVGQLMESTLIPLEIYFEHRNYLPSFGVLMAVVGLAVVVGSRLPAPTRAFRVAKPILAGCLVGVMLFAVHARAQIWGDPELMAMQVAMERANSPRAQTMLFGMALSAGDYEVARDDLDRYDALSGGRNRVATGLWRLHLDCLAGEPLDPERLRGIRDSLPREVGPFPLTAALRLAETVESGACPEGYAAAVERLLLDWVDRLAETPTAQAAWRFRMHAARLAASRGDFAVAIPLAMRAWEDSGWNHGVGVLAVQLANSVEDERFARAALVLLSKTAPQWDVQVAAAIEAFRAHLDATSAKSSISDRPPGGSAR